MNSFGDMYCVIAREKPYSACFLIVTIKMLLMIIIIYCLIISQPANTFNVPCFAAERDVAACQHCAWALVIYAL